MSFGTAASGKSVWGFSPQSIPGLQLWLDGADTTSVTGTTTVTAWKDKSGNANNASGTGGLSYTSGQGITFNGTNGYFSVSGVANSIVGTPFTVFVVEKPAVLSTSVPTGIFTNDVNTNVLYGSFFTRYNANGKIRFGWYGADQDSSTTYSAGSTRILNFNYTGTNRTILVNGTSEATESWTQNLVTGAFTQPVIGRLWGLYYYNGTISELMLYVGNINTQQYQQIEGYLAAKWGLKANLPATHPYSATASVPFNRPFYPTDIGGCLLWLDAADQSSITGTSSVTAWKDKSGTGNNMTITGGTVSYTTNPPAVVFPNAQVSCTSALSTNVITAGSSSIFMVVQDTFINGTSFGHAFTAVNILESGAYSIGIRFQTATNKLRVSDTGDIGSNYFVNGTLGTPVSSVITVPAGFNIIDTTFNVGGTTQFALSIPIGNSLAARFFIGNIQEVIVYTGPTTTSQRQQVEQYLANKWGLVASLPVGHPGKLLPAFSTNFTPKSVAGMQLWLDAADSSTITGTSPVTAWADKSGLGNNATATGTPTISSTGLNGLPTMNFNGSSWFTGPTANTTSNLTVFAVGMMTVASPNMNSRIVSLATPTKVDYDTYAEVVAFQQGYNNTYIYSGRNTQPPTGGTYNFVVVGSSTTINVPYIGAAIYGGTSSTQTIIVNGSAESTTSTTGAFGYTSYGIGNYASAPSSSEPFTGKISEIIIFNTAVTTSQRQQVEGYLAWKWGLQSSLPSTHAYAKFSP